MNIKPLTICTVLFISIFSFGQYSSVDAQVVLLESDLVTVGLDAASDTGLKNNDGVTNLVRPTFRGKAPFGARVTVKINNSPLCRATAVSNSTYSCKSEIELLEGKYTVLAETAKYYTKNPASITLDAKNTTPPTNPTLGSISDTGSSATDMITISKMLQIKGFGEAGARIDILANGISVCNLIIPVSNSYQCTYYVTKTGVYKLRALETDLAGNKATSLQEVTLTIVEPIPNGATPTIPDLSSGSDSGVSNEDNITNNKTPSITGTGTNGLKVQVVVDGKATCTNLIIDSTYSCSPILSVDKKYTVSARYIAEDGSVGAQTLPLEVVLKTLKSIPAIPDLVDESDDGMSTTDNITYSKSLIVNGTADMGDSVNLMINENSVYTTVLGPDETKWTFTYTASDLGEYNAVVETTDVAGNKAVSLPLSISVVRKPEFVPTVPEPNIVDASDTGAFATDNTTSDSTPTFSGVAGISGNMVSFYADSNKLCESVVTSEGAYECTSTVLLDGSYSVSAIQTNPFGDRSDMSPVITMTIDTLNPTPASLPDLLTSSDDGASGTDNSTTLTSLRLMGYAEKNSKISLLVNNVEVYSAQLPNTSGGNGVSWRYTYDAPSEGVYTIKVVETDLAGNAARASQTLTVTVLPVEPPIEVVDAPEPAIQPIVETVDTVVADPVANQ